MPLANPEIKRTLGLITRRGHSIAPAARTLYDMLVESLRLTAPAPASE